MPFYLKTLGCLALCSALAACSNVRQAAVIECTQPPLEALDVRQQ